MAYRNPPTNEELAQMLSEANREIEEAEDRILELQIALQDKSDELDSYFLEEEDEKATIDVTGLTPEDLNRMLETQRELQNRMSNTATPNVTLVDPSGMSVLGSNNNNTRKYNSKPDRELVVIFVGIAILAILSPFLL